MPRLYAYYMDNEGALDRWQYTVDGGAARRNKSIRNKHRPIENKRSANMD